MEKAIKFILSISICFIMSINFVQATTINDYVFDTIDEYSEGLTVVGVWKVGHFVYGYLDDTGRLIVEPKFRDANRFRNGAAVVGFAEEGKKIKYGYINKDGSYLIEPQFDDAKDFHKIPGTDVEIAKVGIGKDKANRKYGFIKKDGSYFVEPIYHNVYEFEDYCSNYGVYTQVFNIIDGQCCCGLINSKGEIVINTKYSSIDLNKYDLDLGFVIINKGKSPNYLKGLYDIKRNKIIEPKYDYVNVLDKGVCIQKNINSKRKIGAYVNGKIVEPKYDGERYWDSDKIYAKVELNGKFGLLGIDGQEVLKPIYDEVRSQDKYCYATKNGKSFLITRDGKKINDTEFESISMYSNFDFLIVERDGKTGFYDVNSNLYLIEPIYDQIYAFEDGYTIVELNGKEGVIRRDGKLILKPQYDNIYRNIYLDKIPHKKVNEDGSISTTYTFDKTKDPVVRVEKDGKQYYLTKDFEEFTKDSKAGDFDYISDFEFGFAKVEKNGKEGYIRKDFSYVVEPIWDSCYRQYNNDDNDIMYEDYFVIKKDGKYGVVFLDGSVVEPVSKTGVEVSIKDEICTVRINGKFRYINKNNEFINDDEYLMGSVFNEGKARVNKVLGKNNFVLYFIDTNGNTASKMYANAGNYSEGLAFVYIDGVGGRYIDHDENIIIGEGMEIANGYEFVDGIAPVGVYNFDLEKVIYGFLKKDGTWLVEPIFDEFHYYGKGKYKYYKDGKEANVTSTGKIILK